MLERHRLAIRQALAPALRDDERAAHAFAQQIRLAARRRRLLSPGEGLVRQQQIDEALRALGFVSIDQQRGNILPLTGLERVAEDEREDRRQNQQQEQHAPVAIDVQKFLVGDARDRGDGAAVHIDAALSRTLVRGARSRETSNVQRPTSNVQLGGALRRLFH